MHQCGRRSIRTDTARPTLDKKSRGATLRFVLLDGLRHPVIVEGPDEAILAASYAAHA